MAFELSILKPECFTVELSVSTVYAPFISISDRLRGSSLFRGLEIDSWSSSKNKRQKWAITMGDERATVWGRPKRKGNGLWTEAWITLVSRELFVRLARLDLCRDHFIWITKSDDCRLTTSARPPRRPTCTYEAYSPTHEQVNAIHVPVVLSSVRWSSLYHNVNERVLRGRGHGRRCR